MSSQLEQMSALSRTVVDGLVQRMRKVADLLALVGDSSQLASHKAAADSVTAIGAVRQLATFQNFVFVEMFGCVCVCVVVGSGWICSIGGVQCAAGNGLQR
jgi:hypothetical protein